MKFSKTLLASAISVMLMGTTGCDSDSQDTQMDDTTSFTGLVIDGRIARGFVWVDTDNDGIIDTYEPYAYTDNDGYYSYNPLTNTNYCADDIDSEFCLNTGIVQGDFSLKIAGGIDLSTGEPFKGVMSIDTNVDDAKEVEQQVSTSSGSSDAKPDFIPVISPLTTLVGDGSLTEKADILSKLGIEDVTESNIEELLSIDFTDLTGDDEVAKGGDKTTFAGQSSNSSAVDTVGKRRSLFGYAFQYQKTIDTITALVDKYIEDQGIDLATDDDGNPQVGSAASLLNKEIRKFVSGNVFDPNMNLIDQITPTDLQNIIHAALADLIDSLPDVNQIDPLPEEQVEVIDDTVQVVTEVVVKTVLEAESEEELLAGLVATQTIVTTAEEKVEELLEDESGSVLQEINDVADVVQSDEFIQLVTDVSDNNQTLDVKQLADDLDEGKSVTDAVENSTLAESPEAGEPGTWAQRVLSMSGQSDDGERGRILIFFGANDVAATSGDVTICYAYNAILSDDDINPTIIKGTWQELNDRGIVQLNQDLISFTIKAFRQETIPQEDLGTVVGLGDGANGGINPNSLYGHMRFANEDGQYVWFTDLPLENQTDPDPRDFGLVESTTVPTTADQCGSFTVGNVPNALTKNLGF